jgi:hypothetical protein
MDKTFYKRAGMFPFCSVANHHRRFMGKYSGNFELLGYRASGFKPGQFLG